jgi:hypothetical protein
MRASLLLVAGGGVFLLTGQGVDVVRALAERGSGGHAFSQTVWFFAAVLAWSLSAWYWARTLLRLRLPGVPKELAWPWVRTWAPRLLGFGAALCVALSLYLASRGYAVDEHPEARELLHRYAWACGAGAVAFLAAVWIRRWLFNLPRAHEEVYGELDLRGLGRLTRWLLRAAIAAAVAFFLVFVSAPLSAAPVIGSVAIVLIAAAGWIAVASALDYFGMSKRVPVFLLLLALAIAASAWNDNHALRTLDARQPETRLNLRDSLQAWLKYHEAKLKKNRNARIPLYLVDAEGGGIRAAYWTATVLGHIQSEHPAFAEHIYSLSGVSGGSLGVAVFDALLVQSRHEALDVKAKAQEILSEDFLSPVVASLLYPDLLQRFLPFAIPSFDRARTIELAWEEAWKRHLPGQRARLSEPFDALWQESKQWTPVLLLNATWVETGKRIIASNLGVAAGKDYEDFVDIEDANAFFSPRSLPLSTAAHMSARFTYVSPAGTLVRGGVPHGRVVDGGYFENSAATASLEILQTIGGLQKADPARWGRVDVYVIHISNEPVDPKLTDALADAPGNPKIAPHDFLNEALSPLLALLNTRDARGRYSRESLAWQVDDGHFLHFGLCRSSRNAPLGWVLSASTRVRMEQQLNAPGCGRNFNNKASLETIGSHFGAPRP